MKAKDNGFDGVLPEMGGWTDLRSFDLDTNAKLHGNLSGLAHLQKLAVLMLSGLQVRSIHMLAVTDCMLSDGGGGSIGDASSGWAYSVEQRQRLFAHAHADPGDNRPYGANYTCHRHTPTPQLHHLYM